MKLSRKRCIAALAVVLLTGVCTINAVASGDFYNANEAQTLTNSGYTMQSKGIINTDGGKIVFDASDLNNLTAAVNECFTSASNGKKAVADGLTNVGTYFTGEGENDYTNNATAQQKSVTYNNGASAISNSENSDFINTDNIPFSTLMDAVSHSQDIPEAVKQTQATNEAGEYLYYEDETASIARDLTKVSTTNTGYPVYYGAVKPENLSAGSAAWVNGELILGTGSDNNAYFNIGCTLSHAVLVSSNNATNPTLAIASYTATEDGEIVLGLTGSCPSESSNGLRIMSTGTINAGGAHNMLVCVYVLNQGQYLQVSGWSNARIYKLY